MKKPIIILTLSLIMAAFGGCGHRASRLEPFKWSSVDPVIDSLTLAGEKFLFVAVSPDSLEKIVDQMKMRSKKLTGHSARETEARINFFLANRLIYSNHGGGV